MSKLSSILTLQKVPIVKNWKTIQPLLRDDDYPRKSELFAQLQDKTTFIGIEVEVENCHNLIAPVLDCLWTTKEDNSLRNNGVEFVSPALCGEQIIYALLNMDAFLSPTVRFSQRTSVHIHMNAHDLTPEEITKLMLIYLTVEKLIYRWVGHNRDKNIFCVPLHALAFPEWLFHNLKHLGEVPPIQRESTRYSGLNFDPLHTFGTIEFRHLHGTRSSIRLLTWINIICALRAYACKTPLSDLIKDILALNTNSEYKHYVSSIFPNLMEFFNGEFIYQDIESGVLAVKRSLFSNELRTILKREKIVSSNASLFYTKHLLHAFQDERQSSPAMRPLPPPILQAPLAWLNVARANENEDNN